MSAGPENGRQAYERRLYQDVVAYKKWLANHVDVDIIENLARDEMLMRMSKEILTEKIDEQTHTIVENPSYPSARHALLASLPRDSFRQRFFRFFWGIEPPYAKVRFHEVTVKRWVEHPTVGVPKQSIEDTLGFWA